MDKTKIAPGPFTVGIVGGGIGGLMLAVGLVRRKIAVEIFEAASAFGEVGLGLNIGPAAIRAIPLIDSDIGKVLDTLITTHGDSPGFEDFRQTWFEVVMTAGKDAGRTVMRLEAEPSGATTIRRSDLLDTLVNAIPSNLAHFGKRLKYFTETEKGVHLHFEDGSSRLVDALVGADGIRSKVKECLLPEEVETTRPRYSGMYCYRAVLDMEDMVEAVGNHRAHVASWYLGKSTYAISYPIMRGKKVNVGLYKQQESWDFDTWIRPATKEDMIQDFEHMGDSIRGIMEFISDTSQWAIFEHPPISTYFKSKVAILGDAAHASTPHQGAGAGQAIEDAHVLAEVLSDSLVSQASLIPLAFEAYDHVRRPRSQRVVQSSQENVELICLCKPGVDDDTEKVTAELRTRFRWLWDLDVAEQARHSRHILHELHKGST